MIRHTVYLTFPGNAAAALAYYQSVFGGELTIQKYSEFDISGFPYEPDPDWVAHGELRGTVNMSGGDGGEHALGSPVYAMMIYATDVDEGRAVLEKLAEDGGGHVTPYGKAPWGDYYGETRDRFGVTWAVVSSERMEG